LLNQNITKKILKKEKKNSLQNKKKEEGRLPFSTWAEKIGSWLRTMIHGIIERKKNRIVLQTK